MDKFRSVRHQSQTGMGFQCKVRSGFGLKNRAENIQNLIRGIGLLEKAPGILQNALKFLCIGTDDLRIFCKDKGCHI